MLKTRLRVLVADSRRESLAALSDALRQIGCEVEFVRSSEGLLNRILWVNFDLMVLNLRLAHLDACELVKDIRAQHRGESDLSILVIATDATPGKVAQLLQAGADRILRTPVALEALNVAVQTCSDEKTQEGTEGERLSFERPILAEGILEILSNQFGDGFVRDYVFAACSDASEAIRKLERSGQMGAWPEFREICQALGNLAASLGAERLVRVTIGTVQLESWRLPASWRFALDAIRCQLDLLNAALIRRAYF